MWDVFQIALLFLVPIASIVLPQKIGVSKWLSPIIICYLTGILLGNLRFSGWNDTIFSTGTEISILFAIPLLLFSSDFVAWFKLAPKSILSFFLCVISGIIATSIAPFVIYQNMEESWKLSGMIVGIYTGGIPNMQAIGMALKASKESIILLNAADIFCGGLYFLFLISFGPKLFATFLPPYTESNNIKSQEKEANKSPGLSIRESVVAIFLSIVIISISLGTVHLIFGNLEQIAVLMLLLTSLAIVTSFHPRIRKLKKTYETAEFFLFIFSFSLGMLADFGSLLAEGGSIILYAGLTLLGTVILHLFLSFLLKIDRDTTMITSVAALYGPAFIGPVASILKNKKIVLSGILTGLLGYAIGNYLGIGLAYLLKYFLL